MKVDQGGLGAELSLTFKRFLTIEERPADWRPYDLYLFRDGELAFYVGQSYCAFDRVWEHIRNGPRGRSTVGRFMLCNWPRSMNFMVELFSSRGGQFAGVGNELNAAERLLIEQWAPCFNEALNRAPTPLPPTYLPPSADIRQWKSFPRMLKEARYAVQAEERRALL